jgi:transposase
LLVRPWIGWWRPAWRRGRLVSDFSFRKTPHWRKLTRSFFDVGVRYAEIKGRPVLIEQHQQRHIVNRSFRAFSCSSAAFGGCINVLSYMRRDGLTAHAGRANVDAILPTEPQQQYVVHGGLLDPDLRIPGRCIAIRQSVRPWKRCPLILWSAKRLHIFATNFVAILFSVGASLETSDY